MDTKKSGVKYAIIAFVVVITIITIVAVLLIGISKKSTESQTGQNTTTDTKTPGATLPGVEKDSVLRSIDNGLNFETYFRIDGNIKLGALDVLGMSFYPNVKDKLIISTYDEGLFLNEGKTKDWNQIQFPHKKIYSFFLDKKDPDKRSFVSAVELENGRIFRTEDGGNNWRVVYAEPANNTYVSALTQDPQDVNLILAGTSAGTIIRSIDGGDTWKNIGQKITGNVIRFDYDSERLSFMYMLVSGGKIYHSYDSGVTWLDWEEEKPKEIKSLNEQVAKLSKAGDQDGAKYLRQKITDMQEQNRTEKRPSGIIYTVADPNDSGVIYASLTKGLYRSTDYGKYWKPINIIESAEKLPILSVAINPDDSNEISFVSGNTFYRSTNYGSTWSTTPLDKTRNASIVAYDPFNSDIIYIALSSKK